MKEFFGKANLTQKFDANIIGKDSLKENNGLFHQIEDKLKTSKVLYSINSNGIKLKCILVQKQIEEAEQQRDGYEL